MGDDDWEDERRSLEVFGAAIVAYCLTDGLVNLRRMCLVEGTLFFDSAVIM